MGSTARLAVPNAELFPTYVAALRRGWSPNNIEDVSGKLIAEIEADPEGYLARMETGGSPGGFLFRMPNGAERMALPGQWRWIDDGEFCGSINWRWQPGGDALPAHVLGHIGYAVVPWKRRRGLATLALRGALAGLAAEGVRRAMITTEPDNIGSRRVIEACGGRLIESFVEPLYGPETRLRYEVETA